MTDALAAEWLKLRTLRATRGALLAVVLSVGGCVLLAAQGAAIWDSLPPDQRGRLAMSAPHEVLVLPLQVSLAALGALAITAEHRTRTIRATFLAVPRRWQVLVAKVCVVTAVALPVALAALVATFTASRAILGDRPILAATSLAAELPVLLGSAATATAAALVALGIGAAVRATAATVGAMVVLLYVLPMVAINLAPPWRGRLGSVLLPWLDRQLAAAAPSPSVHVEVLLTPLGAWLTLLAYVVLALGAGIALSGARDVQ